MSVIGLSRVVLAAVLAVTGSLSVLADESADRLARSPSEVVAKNVRGDAAPAVGPIGQSRLDLTVPVTSACDLARELEFADLIDPFVAAVGLTGQSGALVFAVDRNGVAAKAGFLPGDLIVSVAGDRVRDAGQLRWMLRDLPAQDVQAQVIRIGHGPGDLLARLREAATGGNRDAMLALGDASLFNFAGRGTLAAAEEYYLRAYALGDARAAYRLGTMYASGRGVAVDLAVATRWYRLAAEAGLPAGQHALGLTWWEGHYWTGRALEGSYSEAVRLFELAAERGHSPSYLYLGLALDYGYGVAPDPLLAEAWYERAIEAGNVEAMYRLAELAASDRAVEPDPARALHLLKAAAALGSVDANRRLGEMTWRGDGVAQHPLRAIEYLEAAAEQGDAPSMTLIAQILLSGYGVSRDEVAAIGWYFRAYQAGDADAGYALALAYADGIGVPTDRSKVAGFMLDAIRRGSRAALAEMKGNAEAWDVETRMELQELLQAQGFYQGKIDGVYGPGTLRALDAAAGG